MSRKMLTLALVALLVTASIPALAQGSGGGSGAASGSASSAGNDAGTTTAPSIQNTGAGGTTRTTSGAQSGIETKNNISDFNNAAGSGLGPPERPSDPRADPRAR